MDKFKDMDLAAIQAFIAEKREALAAFKGITSFSNEQIAEAEALAEDIEVAQAEIANREAEAQELAARMERLQSAVEAAAADPEDEEPVEDEPVVEEEAPVADAATEEAAVEETPVETARTRSIREMAAQSKRPAAPAANTSSADEGRRLTITASADIPEVPLGKKLDGIKELADALSKRAGAFPQFNASRARGFAQSGPSLQKFSVAKLAIPFSAEETVTAGSDPYEVMATVTDQKRLKGQSLTAAGGWCAPSETIYDLCEGETLDGLVSVPEMNIARGGINYTSGPQFEDFYEGGFFQTEAEAIAGEEKDCQQVSCPEFDEIRLDAVGLCLTTPLLTEAAFPELTRRFVSGSLIAHQHRINARTLTAIEAGSTTQTLTDGTSTFSDTLEILELVAAGRREARRLSLTTPLEVVVPHWVKGAFRSDLSRRTGQFNPVTDQQLNAHFSARNLSVQYVYDWAGLGTAGTDGTPVYPDTFKALMYAAGTWVRGTKDVINVSATYDAASLKVNEYLGMFMEQGFLMAKFCNTSDVITLPVCNAGRTGAADITCATLPVGG